MMKSRFIPGVDMDLGVNAKDRRRAGAEQSHPYPYGFNVLFEKHVFSDRLLS